jgi:hypothetical protein
LYALSLLKKGDMKKVCFIVIMFLVGYTAQSQVLISLLLGDKLNSGNLEFGLEGGYNFSNISGFESSKSIGNFNIGFYFDIKIKDHWSIYTGVLVKSNLGADRLSDEDLERLGVISYDEPGEYSQVLKYFVVPTLAKYAFDNRVYIEGGPQFAVLSKAYVEYNSDIDGRDARIRSKNKSDVNPIDMGLTIGTGYRLTDKISGMTIGVKYYYGLVNVYKGFSGTNNSSFFLKVNIPIGAGKALNKKAEEK